MWGGDRQGADTHVKLNGHGYPLSLSCCAHNVCMASGGDGS